MVLLLASASADSKGPRAHIEYSSGPRSVVRSGVASPESDQHARGPQRGGAVHRRWWSFNLVPGEGFLTGLIWSDRLYTAIGPFSLTLKMNLHVLAQPVHCEMVGFRRRINCTINNVVPRFS
ncbi:hypothetical protein TIFTF001_007759 [Ficus carica]|uniref:Uncharacterized protein n=1 Tax=Ficus carica TaxID=3494 RepID=A0AA87ZRT3_FICCA|nr:hypothetical protein TIFTF001_007759 [Ficus carica]